MIDEKDLQRAADEAEKKTDQQLAVRAESIGKLSPDELNNLFPSESDQKNFERLMQIVKSDVAESAKVSDLIGGERGVLHSAVRLLKHFA